MQSSSRPPPKPKAPTWPGPSHTAVFLRNLRLLGLDQHHDWPDITSQTFSASQQNSRRRIQAVEWSLYHLFRIWDPAEAHNKLRPFFPPLEPLQSVNLRAALFRVLSDLKKNGTLGREAVLRKTMLDECKGEKFEETLAAFSTAVLRRDFALSKHAPDNLAVRISISDRPTTSEQDTLLPLVLAHRASLGELLKEREWLDDSFKGHDAVLRSTLNEVSKRAGNVPATSEIDSNNVEQTRRDIKRSWAGSDIWADTILEGGGHVSTNPLLEMEFPRAWSIVKKGATLTDLPSMGSTDLLEDLDSRLEQLQSRLSKWNDFYNSLAAEDCDAKMERPEPSTTPLLFREHQQLSSTTDQKDGHAVALQKEEYQTVIADMQKAINDLQGRPVPPRDLGPRSQIDPYQGVQSVTQGGDESPDSPSIETHHSLASEQPSSPQVTLEHESNHSSGERPLEIPTPPHSFDRSNTPSIMIDPGTATEPDMVKDDPVCDPVSRQPALDHNAVASLTERTRDSMSLLSSHNSPRPRQTLAGRPQESQSHPVNQFETPQRPGAVTPQEVLFSQDADYASVFKSRPKIATSPVNSPTVHLPSFTDGAYAYAGDVDQMEDVTLDSSPLVRRQRRRP